MRTEIEARLGGGVVRGVVSARAMIEISEFRDDYPEVMRRCAAFQPKDILAVLIACLKAADMKPADARLEAERLVEVAGLIRCGQFCVRLLQDACDKADSTREDFWEAEAAAESPSAAETFSAWQE